MRRGAVTLVVRVEETRQRFVKLRACDIESRALDTSMQRGLHERNGLARTLQRQRALSKLVIDASISERRRVDGGAILLERRLVLMRARQQQSSHEVVKQRI